MARNETILRRSAVYAGENLEAARLIAADPERYPGLMTEWARRILAETPTATVDEQGPGQLALDLGESA